MRMLLAVQHLFNHSGVKLLPKHHTVRHQLPWSSFGVDHNEPRHLLNLAVVSLLRMPHHILLSIWNQRFLLIDLEDAWLTIGWEEIFCSTIFPHTMNEVLVHFVSLEPLLLPLFWFQWDEFPPYLPWTLDTPLNFAWMYICFFSLSNSTHLVSSTLSQDSSCVPYHLHQWLWCHRHTKLHRQFPKVFFSISSWKIAVELDTPKGNLEYLNSPSCVLVTELDCIMKPQLSSAKCLHLHCTFNIECQCAVDTCKYSQLKYRPYYMHISDTAHAYQRQTTQNSFKNSHCQSLHIGLDVQCNHTEPAMLCTKLKLRLQILPTKFSNLPINS